MGKDWLKVSIEEAYHIGIGRDLSTDDLVSLGGLLLAVYNFLVESYACPETEQNNEDRHLIADKLNDVYRECAARIKEANDPSITVALLPTMFAVVRLPLTPMNARRYQECDDMAECLLEKCPLNNDNEDWETEHAKMRIIIELAAQTIEEDRKKDYLCSLLASRLKAWGQTINPDGGWNNISNQEALSRLEVMNQNSYVVLENQYDPMIFLGYRHYRNAFENDVKALSYKVALAANLDNRPIDRQTLETIKEIAENQIVSVRISSNEHREWMTLLLNCIFFLSCGKV